MSDMLDDFRRMVVYTAQVCIGLWMVGLTVIGLCKIARLL